TPTEQKWILCGQLAGRWVREFRLNWEKEQRPSRGRVVVDLADVTFVDERGETLLRELEQDGAEFVGNCGVEVRDIVDNLHANGTSSVRKYLDRPDDCG